MWKKFKNPNSWSCYQPGKLIVNPSLMKSVYIFILNHDFLLSGKWNLKSSTSQIYVIHKSNPTRTVLPNVHCSIIESWFVTTIFGQDEILNRSSSYTHVMQQQNNPATRVHSTIIFHVAALAICQYQSQTKIYPFYVNSSQKLCWHPTGGTIQMQICNTNC